MKERNHVRRCFAAERSGAIFGRSIGPVRLGAEGKFKEAELANDKQEMTSAK